MAGDSSIGLGSQRPLVNVGVTAHKQWVNVSQTLGEEYVGFVEIDDGEWDLSFGPLRLGRFHERTLQIEDALGRHYRRRY